MKVTKQSNFPHHSCIFVVSLLFAARLWPHWDVPLYVRWMNWLLSLTLKRLKCPPAVLQTITLHRGARQCGRRMPKCQHYMNGVYLKSCPSTYSLFKRRFLSGADGQSYANARHFPFPLKTLNTVAMWNALDHCRFNGREKRQLD